MLMEGRNEVANGWPLGLIGIMNSRIRVADETAAPPLQLYASRILRSSSFSSFTSSNLDTESTESFFPDQSVSLGRLIGIGPANKGRLYGHHRHHHRRITDERSHPRVQKCHKNSQGTVCTLN